MFISSYFIEFSFWMDIVIIIYHFNCVSLYRRYRIFMPLYFSCFRFLGALVYRGAFAPTDRLPRKSLEPSSPATYLMDGRLCWQDGKEVADSPTSFPEVTTISKNDRSTF